MVLTNVKSSCRAFIFYLFVACFTSLVCSLKTGNSARSLARPRIRDLNRPAYGYSEPTCKFKQHDARRFPATSSTAHFAKAKLAKDVAVPSEKISSDMRTTLGWVAAAALFSVGIAVTMGTTSAVEFCSGYILEQSLSIDNLFVFLVLFEYFGVSREREERVLQYGIFGAVILRGLFIAAGAVALGQFHQVLLFFAAILGFSSIKILFGGDDDEEDADLSDNAVVKLANKLFQTTDSFDGDKFFSESADGRMLATPLFLCLACIELSDIVFAFDSVPAVFGVTSNPFIVFTSNMFAIAGLRSLYGVLSDAVAELAYLEKAVGVVLGVIAAKMSFGAFDIEILSPLQSLVLVLNILGAGVGLSLYENRKNR